MYSNVRSSVIFLFCFFFFNDTATTEIYTLSLHDALPIYHHRHLLQTILHLHRRHHNRSEEHTSELQSPCNLVCRLLLEKKKKTTKKHNIYTVAPVSHDCVS